MPSWAVASSASASSIHSSQLRYRLTDPKNKCNCKAELCHKRCLCDSVSIIAVGGLRCDPKGNSTTAHIKMAAQYPCRDHSDGNNVRGYSADTCITGSTFPFVHVTDELKSEVAQLTELTRLRSPADSTSSVPVTESTATGRRGSQGSRRATTDTQRRRPGLSSTPSRPSCPRRGCGTRMGSSGQVSRARPST